MSQLQTEIETLEKRANELRDRRDEAAKESAALDARVALGDAEAIGAAASKRAEMDVISRALNAVSLDAQRVQSELDARAAAAAHAAKVERLQNVARDIIALDDEAAQAAAQLAREINNGMDAIEATRKKAHDLRWQIQVLHYDDPALILEALGAQTRANIGYSPGQQWQGFDLPRLFGGRNVVIGNRAEESLGALFIQRGVDSLNLIRQERPRGESFLDSLK